MNRRHLGLVLVLLPLSAAAQIYRWTDASGQVHFAQKPPATGDYQLLHPELPPPTPAPGVDAIRRRAQGYAQEDADRQKSRRVLLQAQADKAERCAKVRERIAYLEQSTAHRLFKTGDDGQPARLTEAEFQERLDDARSAAAKYCD
jgi:hypothetical protein